MKPQVAKLFSLQYGVNVTDFEKLIADFYEHPFQKDKCIRIITRENDLIIGFQSFFFWPYVLNGRIFNSYQSGNSLVLPHYRGKGIFQTMLNYIDNHRKELSIDFLMGFPIDASMNSLLRNQWKNILDLKWHLKIINPIAFLFPFRKDILQKVFSGAHSPVDEPPGSLRLYKGTDFFKWRNHYSSQNKYYYYLFEKSGCNACFTMKYIRRNHAINELIIGDFQSNSTDPGFVKQAFRSLSGKVRSLKFISSLTLAANEQSAFSLSGVLPTCGFIKTWKRIYFTVKPFIDEPELLNPGSWTLYRSDIDTW